MTEADEPPMWAGKRWPEIPLAGQWAIAVFVFFDLAPWLLALAAPSGRHTGPFLLDVALATLAVALAAVVVMALTPRRRQASPLSLDPPDAYYPWVAD